MSSRSEVGKVLFRCHSDNNRSVRNSDSGVNWFSLMTTCGEATWCGQNEAD